MSSNKLNFACFNLKAPLYGQICYNYNKTPKVDIHAEIYTALYCCQAGALYTWKMVKKQAQKAENFWKAFQNTLEEERKVLAGGNFSV